MNNVKSEKIQTNNIKETLKIDILTAEEKIKMKCPERKTESGVDNITT